VSPVVHQTGWGLCPEYVRSDSERGAYTWESPIKTRADLEKLQTPRVVVDWDATHEWLGFYQELLDDTLQVEIHGTLWWTLGLIDQWVLLRGLNQTFLDMRDDPELVHAGMRRLMEGTLVWLDSLESQGLLSLNNGNDLMASSNFGFTRELPAPGFDGHVRPIDLWGYAEAQAFALVSPAMHEEFVLQYQVPVLDRFGLNIYGCCEALHHKLDMLKRSVPRLRRVAISPWADKRISAEQLGPDYIYCWKPNPAELAAVDFSCERVRQDIRETIEITREHGCVLEVILQDTHTCNNQPWRFDEWTRIAMEEVMREWG